MAEYYKFEESNCKHCYKCIRHCLVKAISFSSDQAHVVSDECILCGECFVVCPQNANSIRNDLPDARRLVDSGAKVYASIAPSFAAAFPGISFQAMKEALIKLGFADAEETAIGAEIVKNSYEEIIKEGKQRVIISTCCHSVNKLVQKYYWEAVPYLAKVVSPMMAHGMKIKEDNPGSKVVFIGPCISKKAEAEEYPGVIDCVITFEDLSLWLEQKRVKPEVGGKGEKKGKTRLFPTTGGILNCLNIKDDRYSLLAVDGVQNCITAIEDVISGNLDNCFIEMSACAGSCIGGPAMGKERLTPIRNRIAVEKSAGIDGFIIEQPSLKALEKKISASPVRKVSISKAAIEEVLKKMGKTLPEHEFNCGSCGYETCRQKAAAVLMGKAEINMCLPYLMERAQSFSDKIIHNTPNGILVLNRNLEVQQLNNAACRLFNLRDEKAVLGRNVVCILDPSPFIEALSESRNISERHFYLAEYQRHIRLTIIFDPGFDILIAFIRDVTEENTKRLHKEEFNKKAIDIADKVIEKQMRTVQEIASLLGETTAETKVALERLKETLRQ